MNRRDLVTLAILGTFAGPRGTGAQQPGLPVIGYLSPQPPEAAAPEVAAFRDGLQAAGFVEGSNAAIEYRWGNNEYDRLPMLAADLVARNARVIFAESVVATTAAKAATPTIPIVFIVGPDPVALGLVASLGHPGGNITGVAILFRELWPKRLELLHELVPKAGAIGVLVNPANPLNASNTNNLQAAAKTLGLRLDVLQASTEHDIDLALATIQERRLDALLVSDDPFLGSRHAQLVALTARDRVPAIYAFRRYVDAGGLISYGPSLVAAHRICGDYAGRILKGANPAELPVQQSTKFELVINLKTAAALGLAVPPSLLARADDLIE
ncbi:MAG: ABC transporter substrate-binding protein [Alphaproteobacteria bacterium]